MNAQPPSSVLPSRAETFPHNFFTNTSHRVFWVCSNIDEMVTGYHTHSWRCGHAVGTMAYYVEAATARGVDEIGLIGDVYLDYELFRGRA